ncbi:cytochrome P450 [Dichomitus squalens LYAD-421 SS1]|uniref:Cytochrome P450 n=2 Tax=Dichomitus squalens TaxID=114155 RepID=A0A4Q9Q6Q6_9APHY|nr:cytochrome P450 [Dichomitus squalens LYAD-421 SS1]EJF57366.1 cytochrome P450 [Dichomitus squalens LYAD-421 SS1]TBU62641.1 cytochrome P450 [Dichomitus squalens]
MLVQVVLLGAFAWALWQIIRPFIVKSAWDVVPGPPPKSFVSGNLEQLFDRDAWGFHDEVAQNYGPVVKINAVLGGKWLYVFDPTALRSIVLKEKGTFDQIPWLIQSTRLLLGPGILGVLGEAHRRQRKMLTPVFSDANLRVLTPVFYDVAHRLVQGISRTVLDSPRSVDMLDWMGRAALEIIGKAGMGHSFDPLTSDGSSDPYTKAAKTPLSFTPAMVAMRQASPILTSMGPARLRRWIVDLLPIPQVQQLKDVVDVLHDTSLRIIDEKKAALQRGDTAQGKDIIGILLKANMAAAAEERLPDEQIIGQMSILLFAATDTTSHLMAQVLQLLAEHPDVQQKVRAEIFVSGDGQDVAYDQLQALPYLDAVCKETLRLYPPTPIVLREACQDSTLTLSEPMRGADGSTIENVFVPKGSNVLIGVRACNRNKALWGDDAEEWKPERWLKPLPKAVEAASIPGVYSHLMTFVGGARSCIGFKFAQIEMKVILSTLLANFTFELSEKPIFWNVSAITFPSVGKESEKPEMWLKVGRYQRNDLE